MTLTAERIGWIHDLIETAARKSGRDSDSITLVAISKTFEAERLIEAYEEGIRHFGENKAQEFSAKHDELTTYKDITWHFVGHLQRNKTKLIVGSADLFHALDSERLARAVQKEAAKSDITMDCLIQVNVSGEQSKFGIQPDQLRQLADVVAGLDRVVVRGLMTLASPSDDEKVRREFAQLRRLGEDLQTAGHTEADILSMGMSGDFQIAIEEGATHIRVGSAIFGPRGA